MRKTLFIVFVFIQLSCINNSIYSDSIQIPDSIWKQSSPIDFKWFIKDTLTRYDFILNLDYTDKIPTQNIYVNSHSVNPEGKIQDQILSLELLDPTGKPYGACDFGSCNVKIVLASNIYFPSLGEYSLRLSPYSRIDSFPGIKNIGLTIEKTNIQKPKKGNSTK